MDKHKNTFDPQNPQEYVTLLAAVGVTMDMLAANRRGEVTAEQMYRLRQHKSGFCCMSLVYGLIIAFYIGWAVNYTHAFGYVRFNPICITPDPDWDDCLAGA
jgi:hypothetical protein